MDTDHLKDLTVTTALNDMMKKGWLDICTIDKVARLMDLDPKGEAYSILSPLHCVHFSEMPRELREAMPGLIKMCLGVEPTYQFADGDLTLRKSIQIIDVEPEAPKRRGIMSLLGRNTG